MKMSEAEKPWQDEETLRELYHERRMSMHDIADHFGDLTWGGVKYWMEKHGIERRSRSESAKIRRQKELIKPYTDPTHGYEILRNEYNGVDEKVTVHRLLAVAMYGFDELRGKDVHHKNNIPWDNRPSNLDLMTRSEHVKHHSTGQHDDEPWHDVDRLRELRVEKGLTLEQVGEELGCSGQTIRRCLQKYDVGEATE